MSELYSVLHADQQYNREKAANFLAIEMGLSREEAALRDKSAPGFLLENASLAKASAFNLRASAFGLNTILICSADVMAIPVPIYIDKITMETSGLYYHAGEAKAYIPYGSINLLYACAIDVVIEHSTAKDMEDSLLNSISARYNPEHTEPLGSPALPTAHKDTLFRADILAGQDYELRLSFESEYLDYSGLRDQKTVSSFENFRILLVELAARSFNASKSSLVSAIVNRAPLTGLKLPSLTACDKELSWLATIK